MTLLRHALSVSIAVSTLGAFACALPACAASGNDDEPALESAAALSALTPDEILGEIHFGDSVTVAYLPTPRYRAYWFQGAKNDWLDVAVTSSNGSVAAFVTDDQFRDVRRGTMAVLPHDGKYFIAVRDWDMQPSKLTINFRRHVAAGETPPAEAGGGAD
jgi:hypothetical protein